MGRPFSGSRILNIGAPFGQVQERLYNLFEDLKVWDQHGMEPVEQSARLHHLAVQIHPFVNGNGRWARLLTNIWLGLRDLRPIAWPEHFVGNVSPIRDAYVAALRAADGGDIEPLSAMHRHNSWKKIRRLVRDLEVPGPKTGSTVHFFERVFLELR